MKKILLINHYAGSPDHGMEHRPFYFGKEWVKEGHEVLIVAASFSHERRRNPSVRRLLNQETIDGVRYLWIRTPPYRGNGLARLLNMIAFVLLLITAARRAVREFRPDLVIASSTYTWDIWPASYFARKNKAKLVYELHDIWPLTLIELAGMSRRNPMIWALQKAEDFACRRADKVVSLIPASLPHLIDHGLAAEKFVYVPNGVVEEEWENRGIAPLSIRNEIREFRRDKRFLVGYAGGLNALDPLESLILASAKPDLDGIGIVLVGKGSRKADFENLAKKNRSRTLFVPAVSKPDLIALFDFFDCLYCGFPRCSLYRYGVSPNKLFEYMMTGLPIISALEAANDPVRDSGCGISIPPEDVDALCAAILELSKMPPQDRQALGALGARYVQMHHSVKILAAEFLDALA